MQHSDDTVPHYTDTTLTICGEFDREVAGVLTPSLYSNEDGHCSDGTDDDGVGSVLAVNSEINFK